ncbi:MAG: TrkA family potassium uptake protein [Planctomycetes bacterium]|jgi:trk system potassium uptake protein TrkA|nr:TrkA family potassium uptake protein [Planctomycetota bacterium]
MKRFVVIGLGSFGSALAKKLKNNECRVTGLDADPDNVEDMKDYLFEAVIGDATDRDTLATLELEKADGVVISLGEDITRSLLSTLHAKELGARHIVVKGVTPEHGKLLKNLGVERVVFPETEIAMQLADRLTWPSVIDYLPIDPEYSFVEVAIPESFANQRLMDADLRKRFGIWVVGVKDALTGKLTMFPDGTFKLSEDQMLLVVGKEKELHRLRDAL